MELHTDSGTTGRPLTRATSVRVRSAVVHRHHATSPALYTSTSTGGGAFRMLELTESSGVRVGQTYERL